LPLFRDALQVWDYSSENIEFLKGFGIQAKFIPFGFHQALQTINHSADKDIDVLFYGYPMDRRTKIIAQLEKVCNVKALYDTYGKERDDYIGRSKIILNIHAFENLKVFEQVRIFYLLINQCFILSEESTWYPYKDGVVFAPYEQLTEKVIEWLSKDRQRTEIIASGLENIKNINTRAYLAQAIEEINNGI
jgi:hypothetical protein